MIIGDHCKAWEEQARRRLWLLGCVSFAAYGAVLILSFQFRYGEGHRERPILEVLTLLGVATICYLLALQCVPRMAGTLRQARGDEPQRGGRPLRIILGFAVVYRLVLLPSAPIQEVDFCRYLWDGRVCLNGFNPYCYSPQEVDRWGPAADFHSDPAALWRLAHQSEAFQTIFQRVHHREVPTVYPPAAQAVFAAAALLTPASTPFWAHVLVLKTLLVGFDLATLLLLVALLRRLRLPAAWCLAYGWCPLAMKEFANSGHLDSIAVFLTTLALYLLVCAVRSPGGDKNSPRPVVMTLALTALGLAVLAKSYPVILLPIAAGYLLSRLRVRAAFPLTAFLAAVVLGYLPFCLATRPPEEQAGWSAEQERHGLLPPCGRGPELAEGHTPWTGLRVFLTRWQMNDFLSMLVHENLRRPGAEPDHWFVVVPRSSREALHREFLAGPVDAAALPPGIDPAFLLTRVLMGLVLLALCLRWARQVYCLPEPEMLLRAAFLTLAWGWLLSSAQNPWYLLWSLPLMIFAGRRSWFLLPGLALLYYLRFWLEYHALDSEAAYRAAQAQFDFEVIWLEFLPFFLALLAESLWLRRRNQGRKRLPGDVLGTEDAVTVGT